MFLLDINIEPFTNGNISLLTILGRVRNRLNEVSQIIVDLESNLISLIMSPEFILQLIDSNSDDQDNEDNEDNDNNNQENNTRTYLTISFNPSEIDSNLSEAWSFKRLLNSKELYLIQEIIAAYKQENSNNPNNDQLITNNLPNINPGHSFIQQAGTFNQSD